MFNSLTPEKLLPHGAYTLLYFSTLCRRNAKAERCAREKEKKKGVKPMPYAFSFIL
jgi:hypothetical protein